MATIAENLQILVDSTNAIKQAIIDNGGEVTGGLSSLADDINDMFGKDLSKRDIYGNRTSRNTANCYVVSKPGTYKFPLVYGNAIKDGNTNPIAYLNNGSTYSMNFINSLGNQIVDPWIAMDTGRTIASAQLSIADTAGIFTNISIRGSYVVFTVASVPNTGANGVISVKDNSGNILWNWHIWVWKDNLAPVQVTNSSGNIYNMMPVNLASKWESSSSNPTQIKNWHYQWGRSVPILGPSTYDGTNVNPSSDSTLSVRTASNSDGYVNGILNPTTVYTSTDIINWFGNSISYYNLWDQSVTSTGINNSTIKTVYDPCPAGFKIPNGSVFTGFSLDSGLTSNFNVIGSFNNGWYFKRNNSDTTGIFFPAAGVRYENGGISNVGTCGNIWTSSSESQESAHSFYFTNEEMAVGGVDNRGRSFSVRPILD